MIENCRAVSQQSHSQPDYILKIIGRDVVANVVVNSYGL